MGNAKKYHSLTFKLVSAVCVAIVLSVLVFVVCCALGFALVKVVYLSEDAVRARLDDEMESFRSFVSEHYIRSTNVSAIGAWNTEHLNTQLTIYGEATTVTSSPNGAALMANEYGFVIRAGELAEGTVEYSVNFIDGEYTVAAYDMSAWVYRTAVIIVSLAAAVLIFLIVILIYDRHITRTVQTLSRQVRQVSRGDLQMQIEPISDDEIGQLALDVDAMRLSIIENLQREEKAWEANTQLITAISHDVRTPLTALMGYLEILSDPSVTEQEREAYLDVCKKNAHRLKGLTDELFGFFLVFGKPVPDQSPEDFDAATLMDQLLMEQEMSLHQKGFVVNTDREGEICGKLHVDPTHLKRVYDNLFSNVNKYADATQPVSIRIKSEGGKLWVSITNHIAEQTGRTESNRIGLQTCTKLVDAMGGEFHQFKGDKTFTVQVLLPLLQN